MIEMMSRTWIVVWSVVLKHDKTSAISSILLNVQSLSLHSLSMTKRPKLWHLPILVSFVMFFVSLIMTVMVYGVHLNLMLSKFLFCLWLSDRNIHSQHNSLLRRSIPYWISWRNPILLPLFTHFRLLTTKKVSLKKDSLNWCDYSFIEIVLNQTGWCCALWGSSCENSSLDIMMIYHGEFNQETWI